MKAGRRAAERFRLVIDPRNRSARGPIPTGRNRSCGIPQAATAWTRPGTRPWSPFGYTGGHRRPGLSTRIFLLDVGYDIFHLFRALAGVLLPGRAGLCFPEIGPGSHTPKMC